MKCLVHVALLCDELLPVIVLLCQRTVEKPNNLQTRS